MQEKVLKPTIEEAPKKKLSFIRVIIALLLIIIFALSSNRSLDQWQETKSIAQYEPWFAAYVDVTAKPTYAFEQLGATPNSNVVLSFIVASKEDPCVPTWGTYFTMDQARDTLDLDRRIARLQQQEGKIAISFGGALNSELSLACTDHQKLVAAYQAVIERYNIDTIDLDLENTSLQNEEAGVRRAKAIAELQKSRREAGKSLAVWLTLPVTPQGLLPDSTTTIATMLEHEVDLAGVNIMTMDYGGSKDSNDSMQKASEKALIETHRQLSVLYKQAGIELYSASIWKKIGATPMIGQNDVPEEVFSLDDAKGLNTFAKQKGVGRMSMWSANRDQPCGENYVDQTIVSDSCSGVKAERMSFISALSNGFDGDITQNSTLITVEEPGAHQTIIDDPATSPYQIWDEDGAYLKGTKVVWRGNVYESKWWTKGETPDNPVLQSWETPWQLIGPVLPGEKPVIQPTLPAETYPEWSGTAEYTTGSRVLFEGLPYQAKWWNVGQSPAAAAANADASPWAPLTIEEIEAILTE